MDYNDETFKQLKFECPCLDCITLGVCKGIMSECYGLFALNDRCSIFEKQYGARYLIIGSLERNFLLRLFKPKRVRTGVEKYSWKEGKIHGT